MNIRTLVKKITTYSLLSGVVAIAIPMQEATFFIVISICALVSTGAFIFTFTKQYKESKS